MRAISAGSAVPSPLSAEVPRRRAEDVRLGCDPGGASQEDPAVRWRHAPILLALAVVSTGAQCPAKFPLAHRYDTTLWPGCLNLAHGMTGTVDAVYEYGRVKAKVWGESTSVRTWMCPAPIDPMLVYQKSTFTFAGRNVNVTKSNGARTVEYFSGGARVVYELLGVDGAAQPYWGVPEVFANDLVVTHDVESRFAFAGTYGTDVQRSRRTVSLVSWEYAEFIRPYQEQWDRYLAVCYDLNLSPYSSCLELMAHCQEELNLNWNSCLDVGESIACEDGYMIVWFLSRPYYVCR
jgi:hypothetical protein